MTTRLKAITEQEIQERITQKLDVQGPLPVSMLMKRTKLRKTPIEEELQRMLRMGLVKKYVLIIKGRKGRPIEVYDLTIHEKRRYARTKRLVDDINWREGRIPIKVKEPRRR